MNQVKGNGASSTLFQHDRPNKPQVSRFDLSKKVNFSLDVGMIVPIDLIECYPDDSHSISIKMSLDTLPLVAPSLTNYKIITHWYYSKKRDLWKGWKTFSTKGRTGNINLTVPTVNLDYPIDKPSGGTIVVKGKKAYGYHYAVSNHSLSAYLGVPPHINGYYTSSDPTATGDNASVNIEKNFLPNTFKITSDGDWSNDVVRAYNSAIITGFGNYNKPSALPFMMYQSIVKNNYVNQNLLQENTALFPVEGDDDWLLPYTVKNGVANYVSGKSEIDSSQKVNFDGVFSSDETEVDLRLLRYAMYDDDYFTSALPWLQRGDESSVSLNGDITIDGVNVRVGFSNGNDYSGHLRVDTSESFKIVVA